MDINNLTIGQARQIASMVAGVSGSPAKNEFPFGTNVIVRSRDAGVLVGQYDENDGSTVRLTGAIQLWKWHAEKGITLLDVATYGVKASGCKFSTARATMTIFNACAIISVTDEAARSILAVHAQ